jgi:NH3-dependent NAD+ synthetase
MDELRIEPEATTRELTTFIRQAVEAFRREGTIVGLSGGIDSLNVIAFNPAAGTLTLRRKPGFITFYPDKVMITQVKDSVEGLEMNHLL